VLTMIMNLIRVRKIGLKSMFVMVSLHTVYIDSYTDYSTYTYAFRLYWPIHRLLYMYIHMHAVYASPYANYSTCMYAYSVHWLTQITASIHMPTVVVTCRCLPLWL